MNLSDFAGCISLSKEDGIFLGAVDTFIMIESVDYNLPGAV